MFIDWFSLIVGLVVGYVGALITLTWITVRADAETMREGKD